MLSGMREAQKGWLGKIIVTVMFGFLILSFGIWGIGDIFRISHREVVASVGSRDISTIAYRDAFQTELQRQSSRARRNITTTEALALGLDRQLLASLLTDAALDQKASQLGLALSDATITQAVFADPTFRNPDGKFNPARFGEVLRQSGYTEQSYLREQRGFYLRRQLVAGITGAPPVPTLMLDALHRFTREARSIDYLVLPPSSVGEIAQPDDAALTAFYNGRKAEFAAPEYRALVLLPLDPEKLAKPETVTEAEARAEYEKQKGSRFTIAEKRSIERIPFKDKAEAETAAAKLKAGTSFDELASERGLTSEDLSIGTAMTRAGIADPALADSAFSQPQGAPSDVVNTKFGPVILRVTAIEPAIVKPFEEVEAQLRQEVATERVKTGLRDLHDKIEDQRASAKPVAEVAATLNLASVKIDAIDAAGRGKDGKPAADIPDRDMVLKAAFQSEVGGDNDAVSLRNGGFVWFDVAKIDPAHDRPLAEVRNEVLNAWMADQRSVMLAKKAADLVKRLEGETPIADIAKEAALEVNTVDDITRSSTPPGLSPAAVNAAFSVKSDGAGYALGTDGLSRIVFKVKSATLPPADPAAAATLTPRLKVAIEDDMIQAYVQKLEADFGVSIDRAATQAALRGSDSQQQ
ncbi:peptidyl-prolyl cis-trans isomerase D [Rhizobiales bacterium GAS113]|nr:peptidyl-prolyl cis-trans isomerase D [Rhizobiales bacterium GAS113]SEE56706.1 peptidyl-prolyl cis-trans isomerase D [Rhizobiales bacterium GAS188]